MGRPITYKGPRYDISEDSRRGGEALSLFDEYFSDIGKRFPGEFRDKLVLHLELLGLLKTQRGAGEGGQGEGVAGRGKGPRKVYFRSLLKHGESVQRGLRELEFHKLEREKAPHLVKMLLDLQEAIAAKLEEIRERGKFGLEL